MIQTTGVYFNGISSVSQPVEITFDNINACVIFTTAENQKNQWQLQDINIEHIGNTLEIRPGENQTAFIKINDESFIKEFIKQLNKSGHIGWYYKLLHLGMKAYISIALTLLAIIVCGYLFVVPWIAEKATLIIPEKYDTALANKFLAQYLIENEIDSSKTDALNRFAAHLKLENNKPLHFKVLKSSTVNAFALPDGTIVVYTGLIELMKNYDELAGLIGHEVVHVNNRHSMKMLCRNLSGYIFISVMFSDVNGIMAVVADNARNLESLSYSRQFEKEADEDGTQLMIKNNINPQGMTTLFTRLKTEEKVIVPAFISTHPMTDERIKYINKLIQQHSYHFQQNEALKKLFVEIKN